MTNGENREEAVRFFRRCGMVRVGGNMCRSRQRRKNLIFQEINFSIYFKVFLVALCLCVISNNVFAEERRVFVREGVIVPHIDIADKKLRSLAESLVNVFSVASDVQVKFSGEVNFYLIERRNIISDDEFRSKFSKEKFGDGFSDFYSERVDGEEPCYTRFLLRGMFLFGRFL
ncbi:hypothetical protein [Roseibium sediminicola]|uniref:Uncharacterized protein n=1 Tax=Roseibium sediminicola TaxID=2933272 RepID=A0ABT0GW76_9HYPH|nr:hypothetical protein [Roseibium sp. CAU 1639]MCK7613703.1 hypothetical protein [Roseibium sp. CAU 1639]